MELCINHSLRRIVDFAEVGAVHTSLAVEDECQGRSSAVSITSFLNVFNRKHKVERVVLPEADKLSLEQAGSLANALENALDALGKKVAFPANLPTYMRYPFLRDLWLDNSKALYHSPRLIEPCTKHELDCPYKEICNLCEKYDPGND